jgi:hypothetical protein
MLLLLLLSSVTGCSLPLALALLFLRLDLLLLLKSDAPLLRLVLRLRPIFRLGLFLHLLLQLKRKGVVRVCLHPCTYAGASESSLPEVGRLRCDDLLGGCKLRVRSKRGEHGCEKRRGAVDRIEKLQNDLGLQSSNAKKKKSISLC